MEQIKQLNRRLAEALGYVGEEPRFAWKLSTEVFYFWRKGQTLIEERVCWADRLAENRKMRHPMKVWMLCQRRKNHMSREQWWASFGFQFPYPEIQYYAHPETMLDQGELPDGETTTAHIHAIKHRHLEKTESQHAIECRDAAVARQEADRAVWHEQVADWEPAFQNYGTLLKEHDKPHVSYGGF